MTSEMENLPRDEGAEVKNPDAGHPVDHAQVLMQWTLKALDPKAEDEKC